jgi:hypothetical protein
MPQPERKPYLHILACSIIGLSLMACSDATLDSEPTSAQEQNNKQSPPLRILTEQNLVGILVGSCIQSTRNCDPSQSISDVKQALADGLVFSMIQPEDIPQNEMVIAVQCRA